jgi:NTE family protein
MAKAVATIQPPTIGLALGGGGARGLAHIVLLEALDELGLRPSRIVGTSIGAVVGAAYASGISGRDLRAHVLGLVRDKPGAMARVLKARVGRLADLFNGNMGHPIMLDGELLLDMFWPEKVPDRFEQLAIPFEAVATDYIGRRAAVIDTGPLAPAVAASMAIPGLIQPVEMDGLVLVDGGVVDPLPFRHLVGRTDINIACDVTGGPVADKKAAPKPFEAMFGAAQIMMASITREMLSVSQPDVLLKPEVDAFRVHDFFKAVQIFAACEPVRGQTKEQIKRLIDKSRKS